MLNIIVAMDLNNGIGYKNKLLANIKPDMQQFKKITSGHTVVMGYNTYLSIPNAPLKDRKNIVITTKDIQIDGVIVLHSIEEFIEWYKNNNEDVFVIGGGSIYKQLIEYADRLYVTHIMHEFEADTFFPNITKEWKLKSIVAKNENLTHLYRHLFAEYHKINKNLI